MAIFFAIAQYTPTFKVTLVAIGYRIGTLLLYVLSMLLLNYIAQRNGLSRKNTHTILLFAFLTAILPNALQRPDIIASNFCILLGFRRLLSLRNPKYIKNKIFDAAVYIGIASLFYFWSILFIVIVFFGVFYFVSENFRNWIIPILGLLMVYVFANCFTLLWNDSFFLLSEYAAPISLDFDPYLMADKLFSLGITAICILFFFIIYSVKSKQKSTKGKPAMRLMLLQICIGVVIVIVAPIKDTSELLFIAAPLAVIGTSYLRLSHEKWIKEVNVWVFLLLPIITLFL